jgi:DNA-directed RNA polymerase specialized sigma24 family protein
MERAMENLTQKVLQYQKTREGLEGIVGELSPKVYQFPRKTMGWDEDACGEFYLFVHARLIRLIDRFHDQGKPFESYLCAVLNWQLRNFARQRMSSDRAWNVGLRLGMENDLEPEPAATLCIRPGLVSMLQSPSDRRNFLFLVLKCMRGLDNANVPMMASLAGVSAESLLDLMSSLRLAREPREHRLWRFRERRNRAFGQIRLLETELKAVCEGQRMETLRRSLARAKRRMSIAMEKMSKIGLAPTNREIAAALGVPKGTVDSGLYWLKRKLSSVYDPDSLRSA